MGGIIKSPSTEDKLDILAASARYDVCLATCSNNLQGGVGRFRDFRDPVTRWIYPAVVPGRGRVGILKVLLTNACRNHCTYCNLATHCDSERRMGFAPEELADVFMRFVRRKMVHGIFLSSGVGANPDSVMERMIRTAQILRTRFGFRDYIHLKLLPGVSYSLVEQAVRYADRISVNLEAPTPGYLRDIAPDKDFVKELLLPMKWAADLLRKRREGGDRGIKAASQTTQFVVGATQESDLEILKTVDWIYRELYVFRSYYSAYQPDPRGSLGEAGSPPGPSAASRAAGASPDSFGANPLLREHRLYQCDFLLRAYGFRFDDLVFDEAGRVPTAVDPKTAHAILHPELFPVDVNGAEEHVLLRVPGIGPTAARRIVESRLQSPLRSLEDLKAVGAWSRRAGPYVEFSGRRERFEEEPIQQWLFDEPGPPGWRTGLEPYQKEKIEERADGSGKPQPYAYPGQVGKRYLYAQTAEQKKLTCR